MVKKRANRRKKAATRNAKTQADIRRKTLRRRMGDIKRVELQLNADSARDQYIAEHLNNLEYGTTSEYVRCAIEEKIAREIAPPPPDFELLQKMQELPQGNIADLRVMMEDVVAEQLRRFKFKMAQVAEISFSDPAPEPANVTQSSGLNMDRPRKRPTIARAQPAQIEASESDELTPEQQIEYAQIMAASIRKANPGRG